MNGTFAANDCKKIFDTGKMMKKKKLYQILPLFLSGVCVLGMCAVGTRIAAKKILIGKLGIENYVTCALADYNWGDRLERVWVEKDENREKPERLAELETVLSGAPQAENTQTEEAQDGVLQSFKNKVMAAEDDIEKYCNDKFLLYTPMRKFSNNFDRLAGWKLAYARTEGTTYTLNTGFDYQAVKEKEMSAYAENILAEADAAEHAGIPFLYVQYPYRVDEENSQVPWGADSYENENADAVLEQLRGASVDTLDLREALNEAGWDNNTGFYETDGHWTTRSGFESAGILADYLNTQYGFSYDPYYFEESSYKVQTYSLNNPSITEQVELFLPAFDTDFLVMDAYRDESYEGAFRQSCFDLTKADTDEYSTVLTAYSASRIRNSYLFEYQNRRQTNNDKRILLCSNSFCWHLVPYLALDTDTVDYVYNITPEQMSYYIETLSPDLVIVLDRP